MGDAPASWDRLWQDYAAAAESNPAQGYRRRLVLAWLDLERAAGSPRVLDIGSGQGDFAAEVRSRYPSVQVLGLELSPAGVEIARAKVPGATFVQCDLMEPRRPPPGFEGWATHAVCSEVLEHLDDPRVFLAHVAPYLAAGCRLVITVPGGPMSAFDRHLGHRRHYTTARLRELVGDAGFTVEAVRAAGFPFFNLYRLAVVFRGRRLITDFGGTRGAGSRLAQAVMAAFRALFVLNLTASPWGWQIVAVVRKA